VLPYVAILPCADLTRLLNNGNEVVVVDNLYNANKKSLEVVERVTGKKVTLAENARYNHLLVVGHAGMGKTENVLEPMIAKDIKNKFLTTVF